MKSVTLAALILFAIGAFHPQLASAQSEMPIGTRPLGLGGAFTALSDDANAIFWNPAGLGLIGQSQATLSHWKLNEVSDVSVNSGAGVYATRAGSFSLAWTRLAAELYEGRNQQSSIMTDNLFQLGYGIAFNEHLSAGLSLNRRMIHSVSGDAAGIGFDLGLLYKPFSTQDFNIGATVRNVAANLEDETYRPSYRLGLAYAIVSRDNMHKASISTDIFTRHDVNEIEGYSLNFAAGLEYVLRIEDVSLAIRGGSGMVQDGTVQQTGFGASLGWQWFTADYVYSMSMENTIGNAQRFGMTFHF